MPQFLNQNDPRNTNKFEDMNNLSRFKTIETVTSGVKNETNASLYRMTEARDDQFQRSKSNEVTQRREFKSMHG